MVNAGIESLKGRLEITSEPGQGTTFRLQLPLTLLSAHVLLVGLGTHTYGIPTEAVAAILEVASDALPSVEGRSTLVWQGEPVPLVPLEHLLELPVAEHGGGAAGRCVVLQSGRERLGLLIDAALDEQEVIIKPPGVLMRRVRNISGTAILGSGEICTILNPDDLLASAKRGRLPKARVSAPEAEPKRRPRLLLVEDSLLTRTQETRMLESAGYEVVAAVDGLDGWHKLQEMQVDAVVTDILMPRMDGLELTRRIRSEEALAELPVILVTTLASESDRRRGLEVGADAYIVKTLFEQEVLLDALRRLVD